MIPGISPPWLVAVGILATALAQILLKQSSAHATLSLAWTMLVGVAALAYGASFLLYALALRSYPLNKVYPVMTVAQLAIVTVYGLAVGETVDLRHALGLLLAVAAIVVIVG